MGQARSVAFFQGAQLTRPDFEMRGHIIHAQAALFAFGAQGRAQFL